MTSKPFWEVVWNGNASRDWEGGFVAGLIVGGSWLLVALIAVLWLALK